MPPIWPNEAFYGLHGGGQVGGGVLMGDGFAMSMMVRFWANSNQHDTDMGCPEDGYGYVASTCSLASATVTSNALHGGRWGGVWWVVLFFLFFPSFREKS